MTQITHLEYESFVTKLLKSDIASGPPEDLNFYLVTKLLSEFGECFGEWCKEQYHGKKIDKSVYIDELGDVAWYIYNIINIYIKEKDKDDIYNMIDTLIEDNAFDRNRIETQKLIKLLFTNFSQLYTEQSYTLLYVITHNLVELIGGLDISYYEILSNNMVKLKKRHGEQYNPEFYLKSV